MAFGKIKTATMAGLAALTLGAGMLASAAPAEAGYRGAYYGGPGFYRPYYRPAYYGGYYGRPYYRRHHGGAVAAGLIGGLALGALAASSAHAAPYPVAAPAYDYGPSCTITKTRFVDDWGRVVIRKTKVCD